MRVDIELKNYFVLYITSKKERIDLIKYNDLSYLNALLSKTKGNLGIKRMIRFVPKSLEEKIEIHSIVLPKKRFNLYEFLKCRGYHIIENDEGM